MMTDKRDPNLTPARPTTDVGSFRSLATAALFYGAFRFAAPSLPRDLERLLLERGWIPHAIMFLSFWCFAILAHKALKLHRQKRAFRMDLLKTTGDISPEDALGIVRRVESGARSVLLWQKAPTLLYQRVMRLLRHFGQRGDVAEARSANSSDAEADAAAVHGSFSTIKTLVWAIPILGFIGTVIGIGTAVGGFSQTIGETEQLESIRESLGGVTNGLAVAFDTTLIALVASICVMLPMSWMQKAEEALVEDINEFCVTSVVGRFVCADVDDGADDEADAIADRERAEAEKMWDALAKELVAPVSQVLSAHAELIGRIASDHDKLLKAHASDRRTTHLVRRRIKGAGPRTSRRGRATPARKPQRPGGERTTRPSTTASRTHRTTALPRARCVPRAPTLARRRAEPWGSVNETRGTGHDQRPPRRRSPPSSCRGVARWRVNEDWIQRSRCFRFSACWPPSWAPSSW